MILFRLAAVALLFCLFPASPKAQELKPAPAVNEDVRERLALAKQMHDIWPTRTRMESAIDSVSASYPPEDQVKIKAAMRRAIKFDELEEESTKAMADIFTAEELKAMIDFYGSEVGRTISAKTPEYERAITPVLSRMLDKAMLDLRTGNAQ